MRNRVSLFCTAIVAASIVAGSAMAQEPSATVDSQHAIELLSAQIRSPADLAT